MLPSTYLRGPHGRPSAGAWALCCAAFAVSGALAVAQVAGPQSQTAEGAQEPNAVAQSQARAQDQRGSGAQQPAPAVDASAQPEGDGAAATNAATKTVTAPHSEGPPPGKRQLREAEDAYLAGAKKLERDDMDSAERDFTRALNLDPENRNYAIAVSVAREHRLTDLVRQATKARQAGSFDKAEALLAEARAIDPQNPIVLEHNEPVLVADAMMPATQATGQAGTKSGGKAAETPTVLLADRSQMLVDTELHQPWRIEMPSLAGPIKITPAAGVKSFHLRGSSRDVIRNVASAYGISATIDDLNDKNLRFDLENADYEQAMGILLSMTRSFAVPVDETTVLVARDVADNRKRLEPQVQETIYLPGLSNEQINELANVVRNLFEVKQATVQAGTIEVRAPAALIGPMNQTIQGLTEAPTEVMVEVKMYEVDTTRMVNVGAALPTQFSAFNLSQEAASIVSSNQSLVQQAIAAGYISATASNLQIALLLIGSGLVQSSLASNLIGVFGGGLLQTGISANTNTSFNLALNSTDTRSLDDVQMRVGNRQAATFREGTRYPITTSTYSTGLSSGSSSALSNASINGVSVASLLQQYTGGTSTTIPQITYEDLGITLKATPVLEKSGRINLLLDLKIEALSGSTNDGNPILESRQFASDVTVSDGESALMVSNVTKSETAAMTGIPGLSELPGFQMPTQRNTETDTTQLVVVVIPHVVRRRSDVLAGPRIPVHPEPATD